MWKFDDRYEGLWRFDDRYEDDVRGRGGWMMWIVMRMLWIDTDCCGFFVDVIVGVGYDVDCFGFFVDTKRGRGGWI